LSECIVCGTIFERELKYVSKNIGLMFGKKIDIYPAGAMVPTTT
jgi:hypothetical protein